MEDRSDKSPVAWILLRLAAAALGIWGLLHLTQQYRSGTITMGTEWPDENIIVTNPVELVFAYLMWSPLFVAMLLFALHPRIYVGRRWLLWTLGMVMGVSYVIISIRHG